MKKLNKILCMVMAIGLMFALSACGKDEGPKTIGINQYGEHPSLDICREGFIKGLEEAGLVEGEDFTIEHQSAGFDDNIAGQIAKSFASTDVDLMCGIATNSATACYAAAEDKDIPVIFIAVNDPEQAALVDGNVTGTSDKLPVDAQLDLIRKLMPDAKTIGIIYTTSEPNSVSTIADYQAKAADYGFTIEAVGVTAQAEVTQAVDTLIKKDVDCFSNLTDNNVVGVLASILEKTNDAGIPVFGSEITQVQAGCAASAGIDYEKLGIQTGKLAARVLTGEAEASEIPYETISEYEVYLNSDVLSTMNITVPSEITEIAIEASAE